MLLVHALNRVACGMGNYVNIYDNSLEILSATSVKRWYRGRTHTPRISKEGLKSYTPSGWEVSNELAQ